MDIQPTIYSTTIYVKRIKNEHLKFLEIKMHKLKYDIDVNIYNKEYI